jgi:hypothetical protein
MSSPGRSAITNAGLQFGLLAFKELQIARFLNNTAAVTKYTAMLQSTTGRGNVTNAEVETFYRQNVGASIAGEVDAQFNRFVFNLDTDTDSCSATLTRRAGQYVLVCEGYWGTPKREDVKEFSAPTLDALITIMQNSKFFSSQTSVLDINLKWVPRPTYDYLKAQAALIPAVRLSSSALTEIKTILTSFYTSVNTSIKDIYSLYVNEAELRKNDDFTRIAHAYFNTLEALNPALAAKVVNDHNRDPRLSSLSRTQQSQLLRLQN